MTSAANTGARLRVHQALERWPNETFLPMDGHLIVHAIAENIAPTLLCLTFCGHWGYVEGQTVAVDANAPVCIRCVRQIEKEAAS